MCSSLWSRYSVWQGRQVLCINLVSSLVNFVLCFHNIHSYYLSLGHIQIPVPREMHRILESVIQHLEVRSILGLLAKIKTYLVFLFQSLGYLVRLSVGAEGVSCMTIPGGPSLLVREGLTPTPACTVVFILLYFATLSSAIWWSITTTTWAVMVFCSLDQQASEIK